MLKRYAPTLTIPAQQEARERIGATGRPVYGGEIIFTVPGVHEWDREPGCVAVEVEVVGGGAGSGGISVNTGSGVSGGGGAGEWARKWIDLETGLGDSETVTVGAGGAGGGTTGTSGSDGGASSFGSHVTATGGKGSPGTATTASTLIATPGAAGTPGTEDALRVLGDQGGIAFVLSGVRVPTGYGGGNPLAPRVTASSNGNGIAGRGYGGGAAGAATSGVARNGAAGASGVVIVREFYNDAYSGTPYDPPQDQFIETLTWTRQSAPAFTEPSSGGPSAWAAENVYVGQIVRNLDRTPYESGGLVWMTFNGDNNVGTDYDQIGLAKSTDLATWTIDPVGPIISLGTAPAVDAGDAQSGNTWWDGSKFVMFYQGNATPPLDLSGDNVTLCKATATTITGPWTKHGSILTQGSIGDSEDLYAPKLIPVGHDGKPRIYYTGKDGDSVLGCMCATADSIDGTWSRLSSRHLFNDELTFIGDAWYANGLYHIMYFPGGSPGGLKYAVSSDGLHFALRGTIISRNAGQWDDAISHPSWFTRNGVNYMLMSGSSGVGIGFYTA
jgi:hypothetical protein